MATSRLNDFLVTRNLVYMFCSATKLTSRLKIKTLAMELDIVWARQAWSLEFYIWAEKAWSLEYYGLEKLKAWHCVGLKSSELGI